VISINLDNSQPNQTVDAYGDVGLSGNGHVVAFSSAEATNFPGNTSYTMLLKDLDTPSLKLIGAMPDGTPEFITAGIAAPQLSDDGSRVAFNSDNSALSPWLMYSVKDALVYDRATNALHGVCVSASGSYGTFGCDSVSISADGKWAAMRSVSSNLVPDDTNTQPDIFVVALDPAVDLVFASGFEI
jgi:Tol biopolymer transport system component